MRLGRAHVFVEGSWNMLVGAGSPRALASPIRVGGGVRLPLGPRLGWRRWPKSAPAPGLICPIRCPRWCRYRRGSPSGWAWRTGLPAPRRRLDRRSWSPHPPAPPPPAPPRAPPAGAGAAGDVGARSRGRAEGRRPAAAAWAAARHRAIVPAAAPSMLTSTSTEREGPARRAGPLRAGRRRLACTRSVSRPAGTRPRSAACASRRTVSRC